MPDAPVSYWENKILDWEKLRYSRLYFFYPVSWTVRSRLYTSIRIIKKRAQKDWTVLELGCGSGILAAQIFTEVGEYQGIDIASNAIELAKRRNLKPNTAFLAGDVLGATFEEKNLVIFLGLTDWLEPEQLRELFSKLRAKNLFFSFTDEKSVSRLNPYFYYRKIMDKSSQNFSYKARNYSEEEIQNLLKQFNYSFEIVKASTILNPGVLVWAKK
jgi:SAM-dependent methyltransferase